MSKDVKRCQKMSKDVKRCQKMSKDVKRCQKMSKDVKRCQKMSKDVKRCQKMSKDVKRCQKMSKDVKRCQKMSKDVKRCQNPSYSWISCSVARSNIRQVQRFSQNSISWPLPARFQNAWVPASTLPRSSSISCRSASVCGLKAMKPPWWSTVDLDETKAWLFLGGVTLETMMKYCVNLVPQGVLNAG